MSDREWLERVISDALTESLRDGRPVVACLADAVERVRLAAPAPTSPPLVWPGLEGEGLGLVAKVYITTYDEACERGLSRDDARRAGHTANAAYLWRAMVASMPACRAYPEERWAQVGGAAVPRTDLAALADPYDGGGK